VYLGRKDLAVGGNDLSTGFFPAPCWTVAFSSAGVGGSLTKTGSGTLTLTGVNNTTPARPSSTAGTLAVDGSIVSSSLVTCQFGPARSGGKRHRWQHVINGGALAPRHSIAS